MYAQVNKFNAWSIDLYNTIFIYSGSLPGGPSPYDMNGLTSEGDHLYSELEPEKPDSPHTGWKYSHYTSALQGSN